MLYRISQTDAPAFTKFHAHDRTLALAWICKMYTVPLRPPMVPKEGGSVFCAACTREHDGGAQPTIAPSSVIILILLVLIVLLNITIDAVT